MGGIGKAIAHDKIGVVPQAPEAVEVGGKMLAVAIEEDEPFHGSRQPRQGVVERGGFAVMRSGRDKNFRARLRGEDAGVVTAGIVNNDDGKSGATAASYDLSDGGGFVAGGD